MGPLKLGAPAAAGALGCSLISLVLNLALPTGIPGMLQVSPIMMVIFVGNKARVDFKFDRFSTKAEVLAAVDRIHYSKENTNMTGGFKLSRLEVFGGGYRQRPNVERVIVLISDGVPTWDVEQLDDEVNLVKRMGIHVMALGITNKVIVHVLLPLLQSLVHKTQT